MPGMSPKIKAKKGRFGVDGLTPIITINAPANGANIAAVGSPVAFGTATFRGTAFDDAGDVSSSIAWSSDQDGPLGTGKTLTVTDLTVNTHVITASITVGGDTVTDTITIVVA